MSEVEQLQQAVSNLPPKDLANFRVWFIEFDERVRDQ